MANQTRRDFLKWSAAAGGAVALSKVASAQDASATMAIARCNSAPVDPAAFSAMAVKMTTQAVDALGGMQRFVKSGDSVWVKPNIGWDRVPELAANTNPDVVATLVKLCLAAGAKQVKVGDYTCNEATKSYVSSGIEAAAKAAGAEIVYIDTNRFREIDLKGKILKKWPVYPDIVEADLIINCPVVKHHSIATMTGCMKNYMGICDNRQKWHQNLSQCLCDITKFLQPKARLCVLDAIRILTANGPTGGDPKDVKQLNTLAAGTDIVALDAWGAELLGHKPEAIPSIAAGFAEGLGVMDYRSLSPREIEIA
ncbi:MAG: DUF362 domain-containing protein [FCB group bacterium]|jgi:uncharacterized protein (DUF362 family)|nr:DUF362 domain-containing protein [FCB group bacterium]